MRRDPKSIHVLWISELISFAEETLDNARFSSQKYQYAWKMNSLSVLGSKIHNLNACHFSSVKFPVSMRQYANDTSNQ